MRTIDDGRGASLIQSRIRSADICLFMLTTLVLDGPDTTDDKTLMAREKSAEEVRNFNKPSRFFAIVWMRTFFGECKVAGPPPVNISPTVKDPPDASAPTQEHTKMNTENEVTLNGDNYNRWKYSVTIELKKRKLWSIIDGSREQTASSSSGKKPDEKFEVDKYSALSLITKSLSDKYFSYIMHLEDPKAVWEKLQSIFQNTSAANLNMLASKYQQIEFGEEVEQYFSLLRKSISDQKNLGVIIHDSSAVAKVMADAKKTGKFDSVCSYYKLSLTQPNFSMSLDQAEQMILAMSLEDEQTKPKSSASLVSSNNSNSKLSKPKQSKKEDDRCTHCKKSGHKEDSCWFKYPELSPFGQKHESVTLVNTKAGDGQPWFVDTAASSHQTTKRSLLYDVRQPSPDEQYVGSSSGGKVKVELIGKVRGKARIGGKTTSVVLHNVKYVPKGGFQPLLSWGNAKQREDGPAGQSHRLLQQKWPIHGGKEKSKPVQHLYSLNFSPEDHVTKPKTLVTSKTSNTPTTSERACSEGEEGKGKHKAGIPQNRKTKLPSSTTQHYTLIAVTSTKRVNNKTPKDTKRIFGLGNTPKLIIRSEYRAASKPAITSIKTAKSNKNKWTTTSKQLDVKTKADKTVGWHPKQDPHRGPRSSSFSE
ncbi:hypothetical protein TYRP_005670 [Tyrophagus putrescentiae]|nr:hypothetical protein TYRP_005670 [Tyrophagus putrescentiae]